MRDALSTVKREVRQREDHSGASLAEEKERGLTEGRMVLSELVLFQVKGGWLSCYGGLKVEARIMK